MPSSSAFSRFSFWLLAGLAAGCASGGHPRPAPQGESTATAEEIQRSGGDPIEKVLQAKAPGVLITRTPNGGIAVQIRGPSSFYSSNEPLYVVDDSPFQPGPGGSLNGVNPYDIESIRVLKNPEDTGIYGMRGANGVILIKTKKPGKLGD